MTPVTPTFVGPEVVRRLLSVPELVGSMLEAFAETSRGHAQHHLMVLHPAASPEDGDVQVRTGVVQGEGHHVVKVAPWFRANVQAGLPQGGLFLVLNSTTGFASAIVDDQHLLTDLRTAAASAAAARLLCHADVETVAVLGTGTQARLQPLALFGERPFRQLLFWGRNRERAQAAATETRVSLPGVETEVATDRRSALREADVVITATAAVQPIVRREDVPQCRYLMAVGADDPSKCELDASLLRSARVFVDDLHLNLQNGSVHRAVTSGKLPAQALVGEFGEVALGEKVGRRSESELIAAVQVGTGAQDVLASRVLVRALRAEGVLRE